MGLKPCRECQHEISPYAKTCPNCGARRPGEGKFLRALPALFTFLLVGSCAVAAYSQERTDIYREIMAIVIKPCAEIFADKHMERDWDDLTEVEKRLYDRAGRERLDARVRRRITEKFIRHEEAWVLALEAEIRKRNVPQNERFQGYMRAYDRCVSEIPALLGIK